MEGKKTCKDLLELEDQIPSSSSSSAIDSVFLLTKEKKKEKEKEKKKKKKKKKREREEEAPSKPTIATVPKSQFLDKLKGFLGVMAEANKKLEQEAAEGNSEAFDIEALTGDETQVIEMDLALGVADLNTPEAVKAAEAAIAGNGFAAESGDTSSDESDSDEEEEEKKSSLGKEGSRKPAKIIELS